MTNNEDEMQKGIQKGKKDELIQILVNLHLIS